MAFSISSYICQEDIGNARFNKLMTYYDKKSKEAIFLSKEIKYEDELYGIFEVAKEFKEMSTIYSIEKGRIIAREEERPSWKHSSVFINKDSKTIYLRGQGTWAIDIISNRLFGDSAKILAGEIDIKKL